MTHFEQQLAELKNTLLTMASHAETAVREAVRALTERDHDLALRVVANDSLIDHFELDIDDLCNRLLAKAPLASDLRLIIVAMKISQNLERVGDEATKIAKRARDLSQEAPLKLATALPPMAALALQMLHSALDAFVNHDPAAARTVIPQDEPVDALNRRVHRELADQMAANPDSIARCLHLMVAAKSLERIADHAKNVAEEVVYLCDAQDIRHSGKGAAAPVPPTPNTA
jgi:phosphate transport system protein